MVRIPGRRMGVHMVEAWSRSPDVVKTSNRPLTGIIMHIYEYWP